MKKEIADKRISALRSGKYQQTRGHLRDSKGYCCLGVLCDISGISEWKELDTYEGDCKYLPRSVMEWSGMSSFWGSIPESDGLANKNDKGESFNGIADIIETNWEIL